MQAACPPAHRATVSARGGLTGAAAPVDDAACDSEAMGAIEPDAAWALYASDTFDRESPAHVDLRGRGLDDGLRELWRRVLSEGVHDGANKTFTDFSLEYGDLGISVGVQPYDNQAYAKLRRWIYGHPGPFEKGGAGTRPVMLTREHRDLLRALVCAHARLLARGESAVGWMADSAAGRIRACIDGCADASAAVASLDAL